MKKINNHNEVDRHMNTIIGKDTTITVYVNPTPVMSVAIIDTIVCDTTEITIDVTDLNGAVAGDKVYELSISNPGGVQGVQAAGEYPGNT